MGRNDTPTPEKVRQVQTEANSGTCRPTRAEEVVEDGDDDGPYDT